MVVVVMHPVYFLVLVTEVMRKIRKQSDGGPRVHNRRGMKKATKDLCGGGWVGSLG